MARRSRSSKRFSSPVVTVVLLILLAVLGVWWGIGAPLPDGVAPAEPPPSSTGSSASGAASAASPDASAALEAHFLSVGKADSILLLCGGQSMLVDAGTGETREDVVAYIRSMGVKTLDIAVATHPHEDHIGGMEEVLKEVGAKQFYTTYATHTTKAYERMLDALIEGGIPSGIPAAGDSFRLGEAVCTFLTPLRTDYSEMNDTSLVLRVEYKGKSLLLTGDIEVAAERDLVIAHDRDGTLKCDVLKVPHHGSKTSSSVAFLDQTRPAWAVITCGADDEPSAKVVERLEERGAQVLTNDGGTIVCSLSSEIKFTKGQK